MEITLCQPTLVCLGLQHFIFQLTTLQFLSEFASVLTFPGLQLLGAAAGTAAAEAPREGGAEAAAQSKTGAHYCWTLRSRTVGGEQLGTI